MAVNKGVQVKELNPSFAAELSFDLDTYMYSRIWLKNLESTLKSKYDYEGNVRLSEFNRKCRRKRVSASQKRKFLKMINDKLSKDFIKKYSSSISRAFNLFSDLKDYHGDEIFKSMDTTEETLNKNFEDAPALWIFEVAKSEDVLIDFYDLRFKGPSHHAENKKLYENTTDKRIDVFKESYPSITIDKNDGRYLFFPVEECEMLVKQMVEEAKESDNENDIDDIGDIIWKIQCGQDIDGYDFSLVMRLIIGRNI